MLDGSGRQVAQLASTGDCCGRLDIYRAGGGDALQPVAEVGGEGTGGGLVRLRTAAGANALMLNSEDANGLVRAYGPSGVATVLGSMNGVGTLRLNSTNAQAAMLAQGDGRLGFTNASGAGVMTLGGNTTGGYIVQANSAEKRPRRFRSTVMDTDASSCGGPALFRSSPGRPTAKGTCA